MVWRFDFFKIISETCQKIKVLPCLEDTFLRFSYFSTSSQQDIKIAISKIATTGTTIATIRT
jgi:hypothetical protein